MVTRTRVGRGFMLSYALAQMGACIGFAPLLRILLPLQVQLVQTDHKDVLLSQLLAVGAVVASLANLTAGALSDRTPGQRRQPWMIAGAIGTAASLILIAYAKTTGLLFLGVILLQVFVNLALAPVTALLADRVPDIQKGAAAGWLSLSFPLAALLGAVIAGGVIGPLVLRYLALAAVVLLAIVPFALLLKPEPRSLTSPPPRARLSLQSPDFRRLWAARFLMQCAITPANGYLLFYVEDVLGRAPHADGLTAVLTGLDTSAALLAGPLCGLLSDRGDRRIFAVGSALAAAVGLALLAQASAPWLAMLAMAASGAGYGGYSAVETALAAQVAASAERAGQDLALLNLAHTGPQIAMPLLAWALLGGHLGRHPYALLFGFAALAAVFCAAALAGLKLGGPAEEPRITSSNGSSSL